MTENTLDEEIYNPVSQSSALAQDTDQLSTQAKPAQPLVPDQLIPEQQLIPDQLIPEQLVPDQRQLVQDLKQGNYLQLRQGSLTNDMARGLLARGNKFIYNQGKNSMVMDVKKGLKYAIRLVTPEGMPPAVTRSTILAFDYLCALYTCNNGTNRTVHGNIQDYMDLRGTKDRKSCRQQLENDLYIISNSHVKIAKEYEPKRPEEFREKQFPIYASMTDINKKGDFEFTFSEDFSKLYNSYPQMNLPMLYFRLNINKNPNAAPMLRFLSVYKFMNADKKNGGDIIKVETLLSECPKIPKRDEVMLGNGNIKSRIIDPFIRDLNALDPVLSWAFTKDKITTLSADEIADLTYDQFINLYIIIYWKDYPDMTKTIEARRAREAKQKEIKAKAKEKIELPAQIGRAHV